MAECTATTPTVPPTTATVAMTAAAVLAFTTILPIVICLVNRLVITLFIVLLHFLFPVVAISRISLPFIYKYRSFFTWFYFFQNFFENFFMDTFLHFFEIFFSRLQILKLRNYIVILLRIFNHFFIVVLRICDII